MKITGSLITVFLLAANISALHASVIFSLGNHPEPNEENVLFGAGPSGSLVTGITDQSHTTVNFSSTSDILSTNSNSQTLDAKGYHALINDITITLAGGVTYHDLIVDPYLDSCNGYWPATVTVVASDGTFTYSYPGGLDYKNNYLTITASPGETISSTKIYAKNGFDSLHQTLISGITPAAQVPEPASILLLAGGLLVVGSRRLRRL